MERLGRPEQRPTGAAAALEKVRQLLREGNRDEAGKVAVQQFLSEKGYGKPDFGAYQAFCDVFLDFEGLPQQVENYHRDLDLATATAHVSYSTGGTHFEGEFFCSYPDGLTVMRFTSSEKGKVTFRLSIATPHKNHTVAVKNGELVL